MEVLIGRVYKHYKGDYYVVENIAVNSDNLKKVVVYRGLYENGPLWVRDLEDFVSVLDKEIQEKCGQEYRFELQDIKSVVER